MAGSRSKGEEHQNNDTSSAKIERNDGGRERMGKRGDDVNGEEMEGKKQERELN